MSGRDESMEEEKLRFLSREFIEGGSVIPLMQLHIERDELEQAAAVGRLALARPQCEEVEEIEELLAMLDSVPAGWDDAIEAFLAAPSDESWNAIIRFAPPDLLYAWIRRAFRQITRRGGDANSLIRYASRTGIVPDVMDLVDRGAVDPEVLVERGSEEGAARSFWLGLAAQAFYLRGNRMRAIAVLREATSCRSDFSTPFYSVMFLREQEDAEFEAMMKSAGVWEMEV